MSNQTYSSAKGRRKSPTFTMLRHDVMDSANYTNLSPRAAKLLFDVCRQYRGKNNGDLCITAKVMRPRGWRSTDQMTKAIAELEYYGFLIKSRQGGRHRCSLYALTFFPIDDCAGKHELPARRTPPNNWKVIKPPYARKLKTVHRRTEHIAPRHGTQKPVSVVQLHRRTEQSEAKA